MKIPEILQEINSEITSRNGKAYIVGGAVRDHLLYEDPKDIDVEVYGLSINILSEILQSYGTVKEVGESFGVLKFTCPEGNEYDFSLPRSDSKTGVGHKSFRVEVDPTMTVKKASSRRDFTMNAIMYSISERELIDPHNGNYDLADGVLRHVSSEFVEDPLRPLRAMQFAGRFHMYVADETCDICKSILPEYSSLPPSRIWGEWEKWASKSTVPSAGLEALQDIGWLELYPEINNLVGLEQDKEWHPEGCVWLHTLHTVDAANKIAIREKLSKKDRTILLFAALCHDFGKVTTTCLNEAGRISSPEHDKRGYDLAVSFMQSIGAPNEITEAVATLTKEHMIHVSGKLSPRAVRRLSVRISGKTTIELLSHLIEADHSGRPPLPKKHPCPELIEIAKELNVQLEKPAAFLLGRHLIELGMKPGKEMGVVLKKAYELQLDGEHNSFEEAFEWLKKEIQ
jgi:tRNA nucleotidyltransferase (CCA-adding enzyme)